MTALPEVAISVQQPWSWLIVAGHKNVENRTRPYGFRGPVLIHAGKTVDLFAAELLKQGKHPAAPHSRLELDLPAEWQTGGIVGVAEIVDLWTWSTGGGSSPWFTGPYGYVLQNARPLPFMPMRGQLGFFKAKYEAPGVAA